MDELLTVAYVSRAGDKLEHALKTFGVKIDGMICADFGASTGGFTDCLLQHGAKKVYAVETGYGVLDWKLRNDERVVVMERTNAMHVELPEKTSIITTDTSWTKLEKVLPNILRNLEPNGNIIALVKPHYEAPRNFLVKGTLREERIPEVLESVRESVINCGVDIIAETESPILGEKGKNREYLWHLVPRKE